MENDSISTEATAAALREKGHDVTIVDGVLQINLGPSRRNNRAAETQESVSSVLGLDGQPLDAKRPLIRPGSREFIAALQNIERW